MGVIICSRHGRRGIAFVCPHVDEALRKSQPLPKTLKVTADLDYKEYKMEASLCLECAALADADNRGLDRVGEQGLDWFFELKTVPVCTDCLAAASQG